MIKKHPVQTVHTLFLAGLAAVLFTSGTALAEPGSPSADRPEHHRGPPSAEEKLARMARFLDLDEQQSADMLAVLQEAEARRNDLHGQAVTELGPDICAAMQQTDADIVAILDEDQAAQWEEMKNRRRSHSEGKSRRARAGEGPDCDQLEASA